MCGNCFAIVIVVTVVSLVVNGRIFEIYYWQTIVLFGVQQIHDKICILITVPFSTACGSCFIIIGIFLVAVLKDYRTVESLIPCGLVFLV